MDLKALLQLLVALFLVVETIGAPIQFPSEDRSVGESRSYNEEDARFHHHKKKKRRKKKKLGCLLHHHRYRSADTPEGRTFLFGLNYYDTDINIFNQGYKPNRPLGGQGGHGDNCGNGIHEVVGGLGSLIPSGGSLIPSTGSSGSSSSSSSSSSSGSSGDDNDDYDYSDGAPSSNTGSSSPSNTIGQGVSNLSSFVGSAPAAAQSFVSTLGSGIRPIFERPERYFDYYVVRPINKSLRNLVSWF